MQIVMLSLMSAGVPLYMLAVTTFFVNARHLFYGLGFIEKFKKMGWKYPYMALTMTDETFSVFCTLQCPEGVEESKAYFYIAVICHMLWIVSTVLGAVIGEVLPFDISGIEFSATAFFITVCVDQWMKFPSRLPAIIGVSSAFLFYLLLGPDNFLLPAMSVSLIVLMVLRDRVTLKMRKEDEAHV